MDYEKQFHKIFITVDNELFIYHFDAEEVGNLLYAITYTIKENPDLENIIFAGTCTEGELEFFGPDCGDIDFKIDHDNLH